MSEEEGIRQFERQFGDLDPELESSFRKYITERDDPYYEALNKRLLPSHLQDCINDNVCPNRGYTPTPPTPTQKAEMNRDKQEWGAESMISGQTLASVGGTLAIGAGLAYMLGDNIITNRFLSSNVNKNKLKLLLRERQIKEEVGSGRRPISIMKEDLTDEQLKKFQEDRLTREAPLRPGRYGKGGLIGDSIVPQKAKPETTQSQQETQSIVPNVGLTDEETQLKNQIISDSRIVPSTFLLGDKPRDITIEELKRKPNIQNKLIKENIVANRLGGYKELLTGSETLGIKAIREGTTPESMDRILEKQYDSFYKRLFG